MIQNQKSSTEDKSHGTSKADPSKTLLHGNRDTKLENVDENLQTKNQVVNEERRDSNQGPNTNHEVKTNGEIDSNGDIVTTSGNRWRSLKSIFKREKRVAIFIDGPNLLRKIGKKNIKLEDVNAVAENLGSIQSKYILLNQYASNKLIEAMINSGYQPIVERSDIYVRLTLKIIEVVNNNKIDLLLVGSRDARVVPLLMKLKEKGVETAIVGFDPGFSIALKNVADYAFELT